MATIRGSLGLRVFFPGRTIFFHKARGFNSLDFPVFHDFYSCKQSSDEDTVI